jgi:putative PIN family toxin of toxin-antitoxin system
MVEERTGRRPAARRGSWRAQNQRRLPEGRTDSFLYAEPGAYFFEVTPLSSNHTRVMETPPSTRDALDGRGEPRQRITQGADPFGFEHALRRRYRYDRWATRFRQVIFVSNCPRANLCISREIIHEVLGVLAQKFSKDPEQLARTAVFLSDVTDVVAPRRKLKVLKDDPDNRVLECALTAHADVIVTGDRAMLDLENFRGTRILSLPSIPG